MVIQEVGVMVVKPGIDIMDPATPEGNILYHAWKTCITKPGGPSRVYYGLEEENPLRIWGFFDWDTIEQHKKFAIEYGADAVKDIPKICMKSRWKRRIQHRSMDWDLSRPYMSVVCGEVEPGSSGYLRQNLDDEVYIDRE
ncbi:hypothetical protein EDB82DRAFT_519061 [Fusarium venenatum]|uniref:uncharacterized protein n=1 Tax=Fusarium venenatum TaxID=56646 RepID=UPI001DA1DCDD|nr:hypothetical protein EDB82DRAFT_519061 [Fusarium venenatum]